MLLLVVVVPEGYYAEWLIAFVILEMNLQIYLFNSEKSIESVN
jgi:hypothetical protein